MQKDILKTIAYFDYSSFPLTEEEIFRFLWSKRVHINDVRKALAEAVSGGVLVEHFGYYCLPGREATIEERRASVVSNDQKLRKAKRAVRFIAWVPFLKAIMVCNSVGREVSKDTSDIDFFIIAEKERIWIVRFFTNLILRLLGLRTYGNHEANRVCLSFYVDTTHLDLSPWRIHPEDIHLAYWLHQMVPIFDPENWYEQLLRANAWTDRLLPNCPKISIPPLMKVGIFGRIFKIFFEKSWTGAYGTMVENQTKEIQKMKLPSSVKEKASQKDNGVVIADGVIKLHEQDARLAYREKWLQKVESIIK